MSKECGPVEARRSVSEQELLQVTEKLEKEGDGKVAEELLAGVNSLEERIKILKRIDQINEANRKSNPSLPDLLVTIDSSKNASTRLAILRQLPGFADMFSGGTQIFSERMNLKTLERDYWSKHDTRK